MVSGRGFIPPNPEINGLPVDKAHGVYHGRKDEIYVQPKLVDLTYGGLPNQLKKRPLKPKTDSKK